MKIAGLAAVIGALLVTASFVLQSAGLDRFDNDHERLVLVHEHAGRFILSGIIGGFGIALLSLPLLFLFRAARARAERVRGALAAFALIGPILFGAGQVATAIGGTQAADKFVERQDSVPQASDDEDPREKLADDLIDDESLTKVGRALGTAGVLAFVFSLFYTSLWTMRTGLLARFWGTLGMALAASLLLLAQVGLLGILIWFAFVGLQLLGRWRTQLPPAWEAGVAIPWPRPGEPPAAGPADPGPDGTVEGEGREVSGEADEEPERSGEPAPPPRKRKRRR